MDKSNKNSNLIKYLIALILFGTNGVATRGVALAGYELALYRSGIGCLILTLILLVSRRELLFLKYKKDLLSLALSGFFLGLGWVFLFEGYDVIGVSITVLLYYTGPALMMIISPFIFKEKMTVVKIVGFVVVVIGICFVNGISVDNDASAYGIFLGLMAGLTYTGLLISNRMIKHVKGIESTCFQLLFSFLTILAYKIYKTGFVFHIRMIDVPKVLYLGIVCTAIGCYLYYSTINVLPITTVCICGYLDPVSALVFSNIFLSEKFTMIQFVGAALIILGVLFTELWELREKNVT